MNLYESIANCVLEGDDLEIVALVQEAVDAGKEPLEILNEGIIAGMAQVSELFKAEELCLPEVLMAAEAMNAGIAIIKPLLGNVEVHTAGTVVLGTVKGDLHDIGKNLVAMMLETAGYKVINLGCDVDPTAFIEAVKAYKPQVVGMSALLTTSMTFMGTVIEMLKAEGLHDQVKVIVGGAPVSTQFAERIGADGYSADAAAAVDLVRDLLAG